MVVALVALAASVVAGAFMAWAIGAGSSGSTPFAPAVGARAISVMRAGFVVGLLGLAGAVLQGGSVSEAVGRELVLGVELSATSVAVALVVAAGLVAVGVFRGYPIATAFVVTGAVVGVGLASGGAPAWAKYRQVVAFWLLVPVAGGGAAYAIARTLRADGVPERRLVPVLGAAVGAVVANMDFVLLGGDGRGAGSLAGRAGALLPLPSVWGVVAATAATALLSAALLARALARDEEATQRRFLLLVGALVAFSAGGAQVGLAVGPLLPALAPHGVPLLAILAGGGVGILLGSWTGAPRMIKALARDYSALGVRRSTAALVPAFAIAQGAVLFGIPISFNEIMVSAIIGSGLAAGSAGVSARKVGFTALAWAGALAGSFALGWGAVTALAMLA